MVRSLPNYLFGFHHGLLGSRSLLGDAASAHPSQIQALGLGLRGSRRQDEVAGFAARLERGLQLLRMGSEAAKLALDG